MVAVTVPPGAMMLPAIVIPPTAPSETVPRGSTRIVASRSMARRPTLSAPSNVTRLGAQRNGGGGSLIVRREDRLRKRIHSAAAQSRGQAVGEHQRTGDGRDFGAVAHHERVEPFTVMRPGRRQVEAREAEAGEQGVADRQEAFIGRAKIEPLRNRP